MSRLQTCDMFVPADRLRSSRSLSSRRIPAVQHRGVLRLRPVANALRSGWAEMRWHRQCRVAANHARSGTASARLHFGDDSARDRLQRHLALRYIAFMPTAKTIATSRISGLNIAPILMMIADITPEQQPPVLRPLKCITPASTVRTPVHHRSTPSNVREAARFRVEKFSRCGRWCSGPMMTERRCTCVSGSRAEFGQGPSANDTDLACAWAMPDDVVSSFRPR